MKNGSTPINILANYGSVHHNTNIETTTNQKKGIAIYETTYNPSLRSNKLDSMYMYNASDKNKTKFILNKTDSSTIYAITAKENINTYRKASDNGKFIYSIDAYTQKYVMNIRTIFKETIQFRHSTIKKRSMDESIKRITNSPVGIKYHTIHAHISNDTPNLTSNFNQTRRNTISTITKQSSDKSAMKEKIYPFTSSDEKKIGPQRRLKPQRDELQIRIGIKTFIKLTTNNYHFSFKNIKKLANYLKYFLS